MSLPESSSPLDYPILTPSISFISLYDSFEDGLIHSLGTLTLPDIDHVSIMKSSVSPTLKRGGITGQSDSITCQRIWEFNPARSLQWQYRFKDQEMYGDPYPASRTVSSHESYMNLRPFRKKASPLRASLSMLSIKLHYIQLIHHGSWLLV